MAVVNFLNSHETKMLHKMLSEFNSESCDKLDGCPFSNKETKKQKQKKFNGCQETSYKR